MKAGWAAQTLTGYASAQLTLVQMSLLPCWVGFPCIACPSEDGAAVLLPNIAQQKSYQPESHLALDPPIKSGPIAPPPPKTPCNQDLI